MSLMIKNAHAILSGLPGEAARTQSRASICRSSGSGVRLPMAAILPSRMRISGPAHAILSGLPGEAARLAGPDIRIRDGKIAAIGSLSPCGSPFSSD
jgi:hypothetical protein